MVKPSVLALYINTGLFGFSKSPKTSFQFGIVQFATSYRKHCAKCKAPVFNLLRGWFRGFSPHGRHIAPMGVNLAPPPCQFSPASVQRLGYISPKLKFLLRFDQNVEYKCPAGAYPLRDFHKICRICTPFQDALAVKISLDLLKGLWSYGGFKLTGSGYAPIFSTP